MQEQQHTLSAEDQSVAATVQATIDRFRQPLGGLITTAGQAGEHPLGVAMALAMASASVTASMAATVGHTDKMLAVTLDSVFAEARKIGMEALDMLQRAGNLGLTPVILAKQFAQLDQAQAAAAQLDQAANEEKAVAA